MKINQQNEIFIRSQDELLRCVQQRQSLSNCTIQDVDLGSSDLDWESLDLNGLTLIGCDMPDWLEVYLRKKDALIFPTPDGLPYDPFRSELYAWEELMAPSPEGTYASRDEEVYAHFSRSRFNPGLREALYQRIHDHAMDDGLRRLLGFDDQGMTQQRGVGIMGGHSTKRNDPWFARTAETARLLCEAGYLVVSGGGPGIMEAANLGGYFGNRSALELNEAISHLAKAPHYNDPGFNGRAREVLEQYPNGKESLAIPTWFYGHEPSNLFASAIAKYFSNSLREDNLLAISLYGVIFAPGSAGTTQEIFQDAAQNHYGTFGYVSPMVFLGKEHYAETTGLYRLVEELSAPKPYGEMICLSDEPAKILTFLQEHPPRKN